MCALGALGAASATCLDSLKLLRQADRIWDILKDLSVIMLSLIYSLNSLMICKRNDPKIQHCFTYFPCNRYEKTAIDKMHKSINANSQVFDVVNQQTTTEMLPTDILFTLSAIVLVYCIIQL